MYKETKFKSFDRLTDEEISMFLRKTVIGLFIIIIAVILTYILY